MTDAEFDAALVSSAFAIAAARGWRHVSAAAAAREANLNFARARDRFTAPGAILRRFGQLADEHALTGALGQGPVKDRLFDVLLRRIDYLQLHRQGVLGLLRALPLDPALAAYLTAETRRSMAWLLESAGLSAQGLRGELRKTGLLAVWAWGIRAWARDDSEDLSATMAAFDVALARADQLAAQFDRPGLAPDAEPPAETLEGALEIEFPGDEVPTITT